eukprot:7214435-Pyramimonas_sp.AAC.1
MVSSIFPWKDARPRKSKPRDSANLAQYSLWTLCQGKQRPMAASMVSPVASGCGNGHSVARGSRSWSIITTRRTLSAGVSMGSPSLLRRD